MGKWNPIRVRGCSFDQFMEPIIPSAIITFIYAASLPSFDTDDPSASSDVENNEAQRDDVSQRPFF